MTLLKYQSDLRMAPALGIEVKAKADGRIEGYASTFGGNPDRHGDIVTAGAFGRSLKEHRSEGTTPAMLWSHRLEEPIGRWTEIKEDRTGLFVSGQINLKTERGREAFEHVVGGDAQSFSIGFLVPEGGRKYLGKGVFALDDIDLVEVSVVTIPANKRARITLAKHLGSKNEAVSFLREAGLSKAAAHRFAAGGFPALATDPDQEIAIKLVEQIEQATQKLRKI